MNTIQVISAPTTGETFYYHNETEPLLEIGRVPMPDGSPSGISVLQKPDGSIVKIGGYHLRRKEEVWKEIS